MMVSVAFLSTMLLVAPIGTDELNLHSSGKGPPLAGAEPREVFWSQPPDLNGLKVTSDQVLEWGLDSQLANDFVVDCNGYATITEASWWGGEYAYLPGDPEITVFNLYWYEENPDPEVCRPLDEPFLEQIALTPIRTFIGYDYLNLPTYRYDVPVEVEVTGQVRYWFVAQAADHEFPPQWGRQDSMTAMDCETQLWGPFWGYFEWTDIGDVVEPPLTYLDASQEFDGHCGPVPTNVRSWGAIKGLYR